MIRLNENLINDFKKLQTDVKYLKENLNKIEEGIEELEDNKQNNLQISLVLKERITSAKTINLSDNGVYMIFRRGWLGVYSGGCGVYVYSNITGFAQLNTIVQMDYGSIAINGTNLTITPFNGDGDLVTILKIY